MEERAHAFIASPRGARLATADAHNRPHVIPICCACDGRHVFTALDLKPKRVTARRLKRLRNIQANPGVALVIHTNHRDASRPSCRLLLTRLTRLMLLDTNGGTDRVQVSYEWAR